MKTTLYNKTNYFSPPLNENWGTEYEKLFLDGSRSFGTNVRLTGPETLVRILFKFDNYKNLSITGRYQVNMNISAQNI
jgi:hypothetical protein